MSVLGSVACCATTANMVCYFRHRPSEQHRSSRVYQLACLYTTSFFFLTFVPAPPIGARGAGVLTELTEHSVAHAHLALPQPRFCGQKPSPNLDFCQVAHKKPQRTQQLPCRYMVYAGTTTKFVFDLRPGDIYWCTADCGWITGHTYVTYGPLLWAVQPVWFLKACRPTPRFHAFGKWWTNTKWKSSTPRQLRFVRSWATACRMLRRPPGIRWRYGEGGGQGAWWGERLGGWIGWRTGRGLGLGLRTLCFVL